VAKEVGKDLVGRRRLDVGNELGKLARGDKLLEDVEPTDQLAVDDDLRKG
jgi:hypothetical protein